MTDFNTNLGESNLFEEYAMPVTYGSFLERFAAAFIDGIITGIVLMILDYMLIGEDRTASVCNIILTWLYSALQESGPYQATIGKRIMKLKVVDAATNERISFLRATGRHFAKYLSAVILLIGYLMMLWDERKQTLHDKLAGTLVVKS